MKWKPFASRSRSKVADDEVCGSGERGEGATTSCRKVATKLSAKWSVLCGILMAWLWLPPEGVGKPRAELGGAGHGRRATTLCGGSKVGVTWSIVYSSSNFVCLAVWHTMAPHPCHAHKQFFLAQLNVASAQLGRICRVQIKYATRARSFIFHFPAPFTANAHLQWAKSVSQVVNNQCEFRLCKQAKRTFLQLHRTFGRAKEKPRK